MTILNFIYKNELCFRRVVFGTLFQNVYSKYWQRTATSDSPLLGTLFQNVKSGFNILVTKLTRLHCQSYKCLVLQFISNLIFDRLSELPVCGALCQMFTQILSILLTKLCSWYQYQYQCTSVLYFVPESLFRILFDRTALRVAMFVTLFHDIRLKFYALLTNQLCVFLFHLFRIKGVQYFFCLYYCFCPKKHCADVVPGLWNRSAWTAMRRFRLLGKLLAPTKIRTHSRHHAAAVYAVANKALACAPFQRARSFVPAKSNRCIWVKRRAATTPHYHQCHWEMVAISLL